MTQIMKNTAECCIDFSDYTGAYWSLENNVKNPSDYDI